MIEKIDEVVKRDKKITALVNKSNDLSSKINKSPSIVLSTTVDNTAPVPDLKAVVTKTTDGINKLGKSLIAFYNSQIIHNLSNSMLSFLRSDGFAKSIANLTATINANYVNCAKSMISMLETVRLPSINRIGEQLLKLGYEIKYGQYERVFCAAMYNAEWFPYLDFDSEQELFFELNEIIATSKIGSKRHIRRMDKAIKNYYTDSRIRKIKNSWRDIDIEKHYKKMISQAINAYFRKEYVLTICCLSSLWETLLFETKERRNGSVVKKRFEELAKDSSDLKINDWIISFFNEIIMGQCDGIKDVKDDIPARNGSAHGWWNKYPSQKSALNAIFITDFILKLKVIDIK